MLYRLCVWHSENTEGKVFPPFSMTPSFKDLESVYPFSGTCELMTRP